MPGLWPNTMTWPASPANSLSTATICFGTGQIQPFVLAQRLRRHLQFARHDRCGRHGPHRRARQHQIGLQLERAQASRHFRRIALAALIEHAVPVLLVRQRPVGLRVTHERDRVSFVCRTLHVPSVRDPASDSCAPARRPAASAPCRCAGRIARRVADRSPGDPRSAPPARPPPSCVQTSSIAKNSPSML